DTPKTPDTPDTPKKPGIDRPTTPECSVPSKPHTPGSTTPDASQPGTPGEPGNGGSNEGNGTASDDKCTLSVTTTAADGTDGDKVIAQGHEATVVDRVDFTGFARGTYVITGTLMDKATGQPVPDAKQRELVRVDAAEDNTWGYELITFTVPADQVKAGASWVVFERVYRVEDLDASGAIVEGAKPYAEHTDINSAAQTVTVATPVNTGTVPPVTSTPVTPGVVTPAASTGRRLVVSHPTSTVSRVLAKTGTSAGVIGGIGLAVITAGLGLVALRRRQG
ncbi:MAG: VaFE repeat-containing surface-anchored protein, partial [Actinomycetaceae bacterium]|nr:VaFE repeat-containing surface-anchored protein [Actinomycetaceae bacterium]